MFLSGGWALACFASGGKNFYVKADAGVQASKQAFISLARSRIRSFYCTFTFSFVCVATAFHYYDK